LDIVDTKAIVEIGDLFYMPDLYSIGFCKTQALKNNLLGEKVVKIIASTDTSLGLQPIPQYIIDAYIANNNIELSVGENGNFHYESEDLGSKLADLRMEEMYEYKVPSPFPKTVDEFITEFNRHCLGWAYIGKDPFKAMYDGNIRLETVLRCMATHLFGDDDLVELEDLFNECSGYVIEKKTQVDYALLKYTISQIKQGFDYLIFYDERDNLQRFFELEEVKRIINK